MLFFFLSLFILIFYLVNQHPLLRPRRDTFPLRTHDATFMLLLGVGGGFNFFFKQSYRYAKKFKKDTKE
jgi:hypothetical protein